MPPLDMSHLKPGVASHDYDRPMRVLSRMAFYASLALIAGLVLSPVLQPAFHVTVNPTLAAAVH